jgi:Kef-type K+ transport system membrane component KefB
MMQALGDFALGLFCAFILHRIRLYYLSTMTARSLMNNSKQIRQSKIGVIIAAAAVMIAAINLTVASFASQTVYVWTALTLLFSTLTILLVNLSSYRKRIKQSERNDGEE